MFLITIAIYFFNTAQGQPIYDGMSFPFRCKEQQNAYNIYKERNQALQLELTLLQERHGNLIDQGQSLQQQINNLQEKLQNCTACPDVWIPLENNCYLFSNASATFDAAKDICNRAGAYILEDQSPREKSLTKTNGTNRMWIGATDNRQEGVYVYESTGSRVNNSDWVTGQPNGGRNESCAVAYKEENWQLHDYPCNYKFDYVCKKSREILV
ncbi:perlucin-like protein [Saccostrea echinata]|uniref:perlucin-like protein n=1 Tax=Saccostrea echinata TaxID=191078 RepID=UPI002A7EA86E|nr:perlucin-like protein [Saccostrea echinata]